MSRDLATRRAEHLATIEHLFSLVEGPVLEALRAALHAVTTKVGVVVTAQGEPAEPFVSPDDLATIPAAWAQQVDHELLPLLRETWLAGAMGVSRDLGDVPLVPDATRLATEWVTRSRNRWLSVGDRAWELASEQLAIRFREGESIDEIADRLRGVTGLAEPAAVAVARTEVVSAANAGTYVQAQASGIPSRKVWLATNDSRTRRSHRLANGQELPLDQPFQVGGASLRFPGDPLGPPAETYNCRCTPLIEPMVEPLELAAAANEVEDAMPWHIGKSAECPSDKPHAVIKDDDGSVAGCHATEAEAQQQLEALYASEDGAAVDGDVALEGPTAPVSGVAIVEGLETGDGREFEPGVLTWRDLPIPLEWQIQSDNGHDGSVVVGRIDEFVRSGSEIRYRGLLDLSDEHGQTVRGKIKGGFLRGVSISPDSIKDADVELIFPEPDPDADPMDELLAMPEKAIYHAGRISALTIVSIPAQQEAFIQLDEEQPAATGEPEPAMVAAAVPALPPASWFANPKLSGPTPITVTDDGRVFGHLAAWGTCHTGVQDACIMPPREDDFPYFCTGEVVCAGGERVPVGQLTVGTGHAARGLAAQPAAEHYDHTGTAVADVTCGSDRHGIWLAGSLRPSVNERDVRALQASALSGDWRRIGGKLRLVAALAVNVPGFPIPRTSVGMRAGVQASLVAAGVVTPELSRRAQQWRRTADLVATAIGRDPQSRRRELVERVHGG